MLNVCIPNTTVGTYLDNWDYSLTSLCPDRTFLWNPHDWVTPNGRHPTGEAEVISSFAELPQDMTFVLLSPLNADCIPGTESLFEFEHPKDVIYIVGSNGRSLTIEDFNGSKFPEHVVYIPADTEDYDMFNWTALSICLYDRRLKEWQTH